MSPHPTLRALGAALLSAGLLAGCAQSPATPSAAASTTPTLAALTVNGAASTTVNPNQATIGADTARCENGQDSPGGTVNCNIYNRKAYVWINGGPTRSGPSALTAGTYFFAVLEPSGQNNPNDGGKGNLSDTDPAGGTGATGLGDAYTARMFTVGASGDITANLGSHLQDTPGTGQGLMLNAPYFDDTSNPGGVYIMALCRIGSGYDPVTRPVRPQDCKYDAFKVKQATPPDPQKVSAFISGFKYNDYSRSGQRDLGEPGLAAWKIDLSCKDGREVSTTVTTDADGYWSYDFGTMTASATPTTCTVQEQQQAGWRQTGNTGKDAQMLEDGADVTLESFVYTVTLDGEHDATVTQLNFGNIPQGTVSGLKYLDYSATTPKSNGQYDSGETGLKDWTITYTGGSAVTAAGGSFSVTLDPGTYTFTEVQQPGWTQTGNTVNQVTPSGAASLSNTVYTVTVPADAPSAITGVNFGNVPLGAVTGSKLYDVDSAPIAGWKVTLTGTNSLGQPVGPLVTTTAPAGTYSFPNLLPGTYTVTEALPTNGTRWASWQARSATSYTMNLDHVSAAGTAPATAAPFRNACYVHPGGRTLGFWSNTNGQALINNAADLLALRNLNLRNAGGTHFDPTAYSAYRTWLLSASATNAAYMTSAQLSATRNNITHMIGGRLITDSNVLVAPGQTVQQLVDYANTLLADPNGYTVAASAIRTEQLRVKDLLDKINNDGTLGGFLQPTAATCPTPVF